MSSDWHGIADRRKTSLRTLWKQLAIVAEKAGRASPLDLVDGLLREAALAELDSGLLVVSMFRPDAARARRPRELLTALAAARLEIGIRRVAGLATLTAAQTTVLRLAVAGLDRDAIAELLGRSRKTVDNHCRGLCQACGVTRLEHATHDVLRVACGFRISRGKSR